MSRVRFRRGRCVTGKRCLPSESAAALALLRVQTQRAETGAEKVECRTYRCPKCGMWHLTSMIPKTGERPE